MRLFGKISELTKVLWRKSGYEITLEPTAATVGDATVSIPDPAGAARTLATLNHAQTFTNKSIDADTNTITNIENADIKAAAAIDATKIANGTVDNTEFQKLGTAGVDSSGNFLTTDGTQTVTNKTIDGDSNTVQDLAITALKTVLGDADKVFRRDASGVPQSGNTIPNTSTLVTIDASQAFTYKTFDADGTEIGRAHV